MYLIHKNEILHVRNEYDQISCVFFGCVVVLNQSPKTIDKIQIQKGDPILSNFVLRNIHLLKDAILCVSDQSNICKVEIEKFLKQTAGICCYYRYLVKQKNLKKNADVCYHRYRQ